MKRFRTFYDGGDTDLLGRVFAGEELAKAEAHFDRMVYLAICLAAKEAVLKTIGGLAQGIALSDIIILEATSRRPRVRLEGRSHTVASQHSIDDFLLTTDCASGFASAFVIACCRSLESGQVHSD